MHGPQHQISKKRRRALTAFAKKITYVFRKHQHAQTPCSTPITTLEMVNFFEICIRFRHLIPQNFFTKQRCTALGLPTWTHQDKATFKMTMAQSVLGCFEPVSLA
jgi:hypothetical protein